MTAIASGGLYTCHAPLARSCCGQEICTITRTNPKRRRQRRRRRRRCCFCGCQLLLGLPTCSLPGCGCQLRLWLWPTDQIVSTVVEAGPVGPFTPPLAHQVLSPLEGWELTLSIRWGFKCNRIVQTAKCSANCCNWSAHTHTHTQTGRDRHREGHTGTNLSFMLAALRCTVGRSLL